MIIACIHGVSGGGGGGWEDATADGCNLTHPCSLSLFLYTPLEHTHSHRISFKNPRPGRWQVHRPGRLLLIGLGAQDRAGAPVYNSGTVGFICMQDIWTLGLDIETLFFLNVHFVALKKGMWHRKKCK